MFASSSKSIVSGIAAAAVVLVAACQPAEDRAQKHYESALELIAANDVDRAVVEFRNVFENVPNHLEARMAYAALLEDEGAAGDALRNYVLVTEHYPKNLEARLASARIGVALNAWDDVRRHGERAAEIAPEDDRVRLIMAIIRYQDALADDTESDRHSAFAEIQQIDAEGPYLKLSDQIEVDNLLRDGDLRGALRKIDEILAEDPAQEPVQRVRLQVLGQLGDEIAIRKQLESMIELFPDNERYPTTFIQWLVSLGDTDSAEEFMRGRISESGDSVEARTLLIRFITQTRGAEAALEEIELAIEAGSNTDLFRSLKAGIYFDTGRRDEAIAQLESILEEAEASEQTNSIKVVLARMHSSTGNEVAARQLVEEVLASDPTNVDASKIRAAWQIEDDLADEAIVTLRAALDQSPNDPQIMTLMAQAHLRNGSRGLAGEMLSLAVETSGSAPAETLRYARFLIADENFDTAEGILIDALRVTPNNAEVLALLGRVYVESEDWARVEQVVRTLRRLETEEGASAADALQVARLRGEQRSDEALEILEGLAQQSEGVNAATVAAVRTRLSVGDIEGAAEYVDGLLANEPESLGLRLLRASILQAAGDVEGAQTIYRAVLSETPRAEGVWRALYISMLRQGEVEAASGILEEAIDANPDSPNLLWARAGELERSGDIDGAIVIYEGLYERLSASPIVANNLASLIATYKDDETQLERAFAIARRLRGSDVPAFQDTYGWIAFRRGELEDALEHLEPAAAGLPNDPVVQYHLGRAYAEAERFDLALAQFRKALDIAGPADSRPQFDIAKSEIQRIEALLAEADGN